MISSHSALSSSIRSTSIRNTRKSLCGTQPGHDRLLDIIETILAEP
jgi:hypothetical protein